MVRLVLSIDSGNTRDSINRTLKCELESLQSGVLPLHLGTTQGGIVDDSDICVTVLHVEQSSDGLQGRVGIFFTEIVGGCGCGDDPMPQNAYCEIDLKVNRNTGEADFVVIKK